MKIAVCSSYFADSLIQSIVEDLRGADIAVHLWALESPHPRLGSLTRGCGQMPKFHALNRLLPFCSGADTVLFVDDDVQLGADFLRRFLSAIAEFRIAVAQPALSGNSFFSHQITLQAADCRLRLTNFVESGPVVSMTREFLDAATPFPESNPMGWGIEAQWTALAESRGLRMAIVDECPIEHSFRPVGARYSVEEAAGGMERFLSQYRLVRQPPRVLRRYPRIRSEPGDYIIGRTASGFGLSAGGEHAHSLVAAVAEIVRPEEALFFGPAHDAVCGALANACGTWQGKVTAVHLASAPSPTGEPNSRHIPTTAEEALAGWCRPVSMMVFAPIPTGGDDVRRRLDTWVRTWLADGGAAVFLSSPGVKGSDGNREAVELWPDLRLGGWCWQPFYAEVGLGLLWRMPGPLHHDTGRQADTERLQPERPSAAPAKPRLARSPALRASVVIAAHNEGHLLCKTVAACLQSGLPENSEIVVADDASTDGSVQELATRFPSVRLVANRERSGVSVTKDAGARHAGGEVLLFLDGHCKPEPGSLGRLIAGVEESAGRSVLTPRVDALDVAHWTCNPASPATGFGWT